MALVMGCFAPQMSVALSHKGAQNVSDTRKLRTRLRAGLTVSIDARRGTWNARGLHVLVPGHELDLLRVVVHVRRLVVAVEDLV